MKYFYLAIISLLFAACATKPYAVKYKEKVSGPAKNEVHVVSHGWHTGFVVPTTAILTKIPELKQRFGEVSYIEFGWGDKGFYQAREITSGLTIKAIFWPTDSVVHAVAVPVKAADYFRNSEIENLCLSDREFSSLIEFISGSFYRDDSGDIQTMKKGIYGDSQFYKGVGNFYLLNTCNSWTAKGLKSAGMNITPTFKLTAGSIMNYLSKHRKVLLNNSTTPDSLYACP